MRKLRQKKRLRPKTTRCIMVVRKRDQAVANEAVVSVVGEYGRDTFSVERKKGGAIYYAASWNMPDEVWDALDQALGNKLRTWKGKAGKKTFKKQKYQPTVASISPHGRNSR